MAIAVFLGEINRTDFLNKEKESKGVKFPS